MVLAPGRFISYCFEAWYDRVTVPFLVQNTFFFRDGAP